MVKGIFNKGFLKLWGVIIVIVLWWLAKVLFFRGTDFLPSPFEAFAKIGDLFLNGRLQVDADATLRKFGLGFGLAVFLGVPAGLVLGFWQKGYETFEIVIDFFRSIPVTALFPLFILFWGIGNTTIVAMVTVACFFVILINSAYGVIYVNRTYLTVMDSLKATLLQKFTNVIFYEALPFLFVGIRVAVSFGLIVVIVSEMFIGSQYGLGSRIYEAYESSLITDVYALTIVIGVLGYLLNKIFLVLEKKIVHWKGGKL